jgi:hypothetical protein
VYSVGGLYYVQKCTVLTLNYDKMCLFAIKNMILITLWVYYFTKSNNVYLKALIFCKKKYAIYSNGLVE